jgi:hypothetical protein
VVEERIGGSDEADGMPTVLRIGLSVSVLAVASGPYVKGASKMAQSCARVEKVSASRQYLAGVAVLGLLTRFLGVVAFRNGTVVDTFNIHSVLAETRPLAAHNVRLGHTPAGDDADYSRLLAVSALDVADAVKLETS